VKNVNKVARASAVAEQKPSDKKVKEKTWTGKKFPQQRREKKVFCGFVIHTRRQIFVGLHHSTKVSSKARK
jgi:hypothetical protein